MKKYDKLKQINQITDPVRQISRTVNKIVPLAIERLTDMMIPVVKTMSEMAKSPRQTWKLFFVH